jgi:hypothetical protein
LTWQPAVFERQFASLSSKLFHYHESVIGV